MGKVGNKRVWSFELKISDQDLFEVHKCDLFLQYSPIQLDHFMSNQAIFLSHTLSLPCFADLGCLLQYRGASR